MYSSCRRGPTYTGLKSAEHIEKGIRERFQLDLETRKRAKECAKAGREYIEAYTAYSTTSKSSPK